MGRMTLYHTGFEEIRRPDIYYGRKNADFGQGFYTSDDRAFSERWAKERTGSITYFNVYDFLAVLRAGQQRADRRLSGNSPQRRDGISGTFCGSDAETSGG